MKRIKGMTEIKISVEDINHLNMLIDRDEAKPPIVKTYASCEGTFTVCPTCNKLVVDSYVFCPDCGQRLDKENVAL